MVVVVTALCSMVSVVKSLFLLKSARDFFSMKEIRASRGEERAFLFVWFLEFFLLLVFFFFVGNLFVFLPQKHEKLFV